jgi:hypothetical protein
MSLNTVEEDIATFKKRLLTDPLVILLERANNIVTYAQSIVRVDTGTLRSDIRTEIKQTGEIITVAVKAGGTQVNPKTGRVCDYAQIIEQKYPFIAPAVEAYREQIKADLEALHE